MQNLNILKVVLADSGKSKKWLAVQLGKSPVIVSNWRTHTTQTDMYTLVKILDIPNVSIRELLVDRNSQ